MPIETIRNFSIRKISVLDKDSNIDASLMPKLSIDEIKLIYKFMLTSRVFDEKTLKMQRQGRLGTCVQCTGQEASSLGAAFALRKQDWIFPAYRENAAMFYRGVPMKNLLLFWMGFEEGNLMPLESNVFPMCMPIATHLLYAAGFAWGNKLKKKDIISAVFFGDGATSEGDFHEALNFASVYKLPIIFVCQNNHLAISTPIEKQTGSKTIAQKAIAYGIDGIQADGNDIFAVIKATQIAVENAKNFKPTLIECITYRIASHTTADDPTRYCKEEYVNSWKEKDPIELLKKYMMKQGIYSESFEMEIIERAEKDFNRDFEESEKFSVPSDEIFKYAYKEMPWNIREQLDEVIARDIKRMSE